MAVLVLSAGNVFFFPADSFSAPPSSEFPEPARGPAVDIGSAPIVVIGRTTSVSVELDPTTGMIYSRARFAVERVQRGEVNSEITVETLGGMLADGRFAYVEHQPTFAVGDRSRLFLHESSGSGHYRVFGDDQGKQDGAISGDLWWKRFQECGGPPAFCLTGHQSLLASMPVHYRVNPNTADVTNEASAVFGGFAKWEDDPDTSFDFTYDGSTSLNYEDNDGTNAVFWGFPPANWAARATWWGDAGDCRIYEFDVQFNDVHNWASQYDIGSVATHESGHAIGMWHVEDSNQVMHHSYTGQVNLGLGDIHGLRNMYGFSDGEALGWFLRNSNSQGVSNLHFPFKKAGDTVVGNWDGGGLEWDTPGIRCMGRFHLRNSNSDGVVDVWFDFGNSGDTPIVGDWLLDANYADRLGVVRAGMWYLRYSLTTGVADLTFQYGDANDVKVAGDWNGDLVDTPGVFRNGMWYLRNSNSTGIADVSIHYGNPDDVPVVGDWNGDNIDTIGVFRAGMWYLNDQNDSSAPEYVFQYGNPDDIPIVGDWNLDNLDTPGVVRQSSNG